MIVSAVSIPAEAEKDAESVLNCPLLVTRGRTAFLRDLAQPRKGQSSTHLQRGTYERGAGRDKSVARTSLEDQGIWSQKNKYRQAP